MVVEEVVVGVVGHMIGPEKTSTWPRGWSRAVLHQHAFCASGVWLSVEPNHVKKAGLGA